MIIHPIIPIWLMLIICILFLVLKRKGTFAYIRQIIIVLLLFVINLRIMIKDGSSQTVAGGVDILFVVDNTISMLAEDYNGDERRIDAVKADCKYIMEQFPGASYSVISFGNSVQTMIPYTVDMDIALQAIESLNGQTENYAKGTTFHNVMEKMEKSLNNERETYQVVFFITDGEITGDGELGSFSGLEKYINHGAVLGYGTTEGGRMKVISYVGTEDAPEYLYYYDDNYDKKIGISRIDEENLKRIASDMKIDYVHMTQQKQIYNLIDQIQAKVESSDYISEIESTDGYTDIYYYFVIPLVILLIIDFVYYRRKI